MTNEILIILSFLITYGGVVAFYRFFGRGRRLRPAFYATANATECQNASQYTCQFSFHEFLLPRAFITQVSLSIAIIAYLLFLMLPLFLLFMLNITIERSVNSASFLLFLA